MTVSYPWRRLIPLTTSPQLVPTPYEDLLTDILDHGNHRGDRTGTGTTSVFGRQIRYDLSTSFPLLTTKTVRFKAVAVELLWFLRGSTNVRWLQDRNVHIWDEWADQNGDLGPVYGAQWRSWPAPNGESIDQIGKVIDSLRTNPYSRRHVVSAWNPAEVDEMALPPCHALFQFYVEPVESGPDRLSCQLYQRSADMFLGVPFNIASYALLTHLVADQVGMVPGDFVWTGGDCHIYDNHREQVELQLSRQPRPYPTLEVGHRSSIDLYDLDDLTVHGYDPHPPIKAPIAV